MACVNVGGGGGGGGRETVALLYQFYQFSIFPPCVLSSFVMMYCQIPSGCTASGCTASSLQQLVQLVELLG